MLIQQIRYLEELAANAWPAEIVQLIDGWRLRYTQGVSRRINSAWTNGAGGVHTLAEKLEMVEAFYGRFQSPPRYQICAAARPHNLDEVLAGRGYTIDAPTHVQTAVLASVRRHTQTTLSDSVTISAAFDSDWFAAQCAMGQLDEHTATVRRAALQRIGAVTGYAQLKMGGKSVGIGLGVYERGWVGVFNMTTHPDHRRQGIATAIMHELAQWGQAQGATQIYLQVMDNNIPAGTLYQRFGFTTLYDYHYREMIHGM